MHSNNKVSSTSKVQASQPLTPPAEQKTGKMDAGHTVEAVALNKGYWLKRPWAAAALATAIIGICCLIGGIALAPYILAAAIPVLVTGLALVAIGSGVMVYQHKNYSKKQQQPADSKQQQPADSKQQQPADSKTNSQHSSSKTKQPTKVSDNETTIIKTMQNLLGANKRQELAQYAKKNCSLNPIAGDGDCLFHSVASAKKDSAVKTSPGCPHPYRQSVADEIAKGVIIPDVLLQGAMDNEDLSVANAMSNPVMAENLLKSNSNPTVAQTYAYYLRNTKMYAGDPELAVLPNIVKRDIVVLTIDRTPDKLRDALVKKGFDPKKLNLLDKNAVIQKAQNILRLNDYDWSYCQTYKAEESTGDPLFLFFLGNHFQNLIPKPAGPKSHS